MKFLFAGMTALAAMVMIFGANEAIGGGKVTIPQVMQKAMKGGLCTKVATGKASDAEKKELVALFEGLAANTPPKGDAGSWKEKTGALVSAAKAALAGDKDAGAALKKAANCAGCHGAHK